MSLDDAPDHATQRASSADPTSTTVHVPAPPVPAQRSEPAPAAVSERLRFGPGVPPASSVALVSGAAASPLPASRRRGAVVLSGAFTLAVVTFVVWFLWPAGPLRVRSVSVAAHPAALGCRGVADVVATVATNGNPGTLRYRWERGDGKQSGVLRQSLSSGQHSAKLHLGWSFSGPGSYAATATVRILQPSMLAAGVQASATAHFSYGCSTG